MKKLFILSILIVLYSCASKSSIIKHKQEIIEVMENQEKAWSNHNLEGFMDGYWKSDTLRFYGSNGITYGWKKTLENYKKSYPTKNHTGTLQFKINSISQIEKNSYYVMGEYYLTREIGKANGIFMIIFKKINGSWKIVADTSC